ncbi:MAG: cell division protein FtsQ [Candidatus Omnitrophica bacterium]|nr:cell division protein FtsQ [Candidatus Omnitrophota bacterium]
MPARRDRLNGGSASGRRRILSVSAASGVMGFLALQAMAQGVVGAPCFLVRQVEVCWPSEMSVPRRAYRLVPPTSIFKVNLNAVGAALAAHHPAAEVEKVERILPNRLVAALRPRKVVAQLFLERYYPLGEDGRVAAAGRGSPWSGLPVIFLEGKRRPFQVGEAPDSPGFLRALDLIRTARQHNGILGHAVSTIRVREGALFLALDSGVEIRLPVENLQAGWRRLTQLLAQRPELLDQTRYLDFRFEDPVIGKGPARGK